MAFDVFVLSAVTRELKQCLENARIVKIHQPHRLSLTLKFHGTAGDGRLFISAHPKDARMHLIENAPENPSSPPLFCMVLRKYLEGAKVVSIVQRPLERVLDFDFAYFNELGDASTCRLTVEIMGKHSNIILLDKNGVILDAARRYSAALSRWRQVLPGLPYVPPPPQNKLFWPGADEEALSRALWQLPAETPLNEGLTQALAGLSPLAAKETALAGGLSPSLPVGQLGAYEMGRLQSALDQWERKSAAGDFSPTLLTENNERDFAAFAPLSWENKNCRGFSSMSAALESFYSAKDSAELFAARQRELLKLAGQHCTRLEKKISLQEDDLRQAQAGERYKEAGDLLCANLFSLKNGMESVVLENFYNQGEPLEIKLNPLFSPEQNLRHYYKLYNKCKNSIKSISCQLAANKEELDYLRAVVFSLENSLCQEDLQAVKEELRETGYLKEQKGGKKEKAAAALPPLSFTSSDGFNILCGRNNRQNDLLTLKTAAKNDLWLHAKDIPGSHVVIRCAGAPVPESTLLEAAQIAAWHSKARQSPKVPVDYTTVAQVKKPSGAKPGMVIYFQQKTLMVEPKESVGKIE